MEQGVIEREPSAEQYIRDAWSEVVVPHVSEELLMHAEVVLVATLNAYSHKDRKYHTLEHIADCLKKLEPYEDREDYLQLFLAILWHDVIYDTDYNPNKQSNEERSADRAVDCMELLHIPGSSKVYRLIRITESHEPSQEDEALVCDIDMSILAASENIYDAYAEGIRFEYGQFTDEQFYPARLDILKKFKDPFHHRDFLHLNEIAKQNVEREKLALEQQVSVIEWLKGS